MRVLLITHADLARGERRSESRFVAGLCNVADVTVVEWEDLALPSITAASGAAGMVPSDFDACLMFVRFRLLEAAGAFEWSGFSGLKVWLEHDAWFNYSPAHRQWHGRFPAVYRRDGFHLMIATGRRTTELLRADDVNAVWVPKGYSDDVFFDLRRDRTGTCTFGTMWPSRRALIHHLRGQGVEITDVSGPFEELNERLNAYLTGLVCNMPGTPPFGRAGRAINRVLPQFVRESPAIEPMIKTFEVAATGCAPVIDHLDELEELGFVDGESCLTYRTFGDAADTLRTASIGELRLVGAAAAELARTRHTWRHRALQVVEVLRTA